MGKNVLTISDSYKRLCAMPLFLSLDKADDKGHTIRWMIGVHPALNPAYVLPHTKETPT